VLTRLELYANVSAEEPGRTFNHAFLLQLERSGQGRAIRLNGIKRSPGVEDAVSHKDVPLGRGGIGIALPLTGCDLSDQGTR